MQRVVEVENDLGVSKEGASEALRKQGVDGYENVEFTYGEDDTKPATKSRPGKGIRAAAQRGAKAQGKENGAKRRSSR